MTKRKRTACIQNKRSVNTNLTKHSSYLYTNKGMKSKCMKYLYTNKGILAIFRENSYTHQYIKLQGLDIYINKYLQRNIHTTKY